MNQKILFILIISLFFSACGKAALNQEKKISPEEQLKLFSDTKFENNKPTIWDVGDTTITNEDRLDLFEPKVRGIQGGYVGVGSTQNLSLAAWAKSEWIWLMDFTKIVVRTNRVNIAFLQEAKTPKEFRNLWENKSEKEAFALIEKFYENDPQLPDYKKAWKTSKPFQQKRFRTDDKVFKKRGTKLWLYDQENFDHIRNLALNGRIQAIEGDLRGPITVLSIAEQAKKMNIKIRSIYFSNAEEYFTLQGQFRTNWTSIPVDEKSVVIRTISVKKYKFPWAEDSDFSTDRGFHYCIQPALNYQQWLTHAPDTLKVAEILDAGKTDKSGFTLADGLPVIPNSDATANKTGKSEGSDSSKSSDGGSKK
ncbi:MAG: hypothetical protein JJT78_00210 [Leptospira sp.]|nr:hypothetical protein [Leptospira sp.]